MKNQIFTLILSLVVVVFLSNANTFAQNKPDKNEKKEVKMEK